MGSGPHSSRLLKRGKEKEKTVTDAGTSRKREKKVREKSRVACTSPIFLPKRKEKQ